MYILFRKVKCVVPCLIEITLLLYQDELQEEVQTELRFSSYWLLLLLLLLLLHIFGFLLLCMYLAINTRRNIITPVITHSLLLHTTPDAHWIPHMVSLRICYTPNFLPWSPPLAPNCGLPMGIRIIFLLLLRLQASVFKLDPAPRLWTTLFLFLDVYWRHYLSNEAAELQLGKPCYAQLDYVDFESYKLSFFCKIET